GSMNDFQPFPPDRASSPSGVARKLPTLAYQGWFSRRNRRHLRELSVFSRRAGGHFNNLFFERTKA
ncbi:MAG: hypothetical protein KC643_33200, partial [Nitrospira sp.]|nr:hypothetical protein [Nitrospira sp.]